MTPRSSGTLFFRSSAPMGQNRMVVVNVERFPKLQEDHIYGNETVNSGHFRFPQDSRV